MEKADDGGWLALDLIGDEDGPVVVGRGFPDQPFAFMACAKAARIEFGVMHVPGVELAEERKGAPAPAGISSEPDPDDDSPSP